MKQLTLSEIIILADFYRHNIATALAVREATRTNPSMKIDASKFVKDSLDGLEGLQKLLTERAAETNDKEPSE